MSKGTFFRSTHLFVFAVLFLLVGCSAQSTAPQNTSVLEASTNAHLESAEATAAPEESPAEEKKETVVPVPQDGQTTQPGISTDTSLTTPAIAVPTPDPGLTGTTLCLTFDDGPAWNNTPKVLKALKQYDVKATFFVCGPDTPDRRKLIRQAFDEGHVIGIHCLSHRLKTLYQSEESFFADFDQVERMIVETTGVQPTVYRFPGGTNNGYISKALSDLLIEKLKARGYEYYDWNVMGKDETRPSAERIAKSVVNSCKYRSRAKTPSLILLHDSEGRYTTGDAVPLLLKPLLAAGYTFQVLSPSIEPVHLVKH